MDSGALDSQTHAPDRPLNPSFLWNEPGLDVADAAVAPCWEPQFLELLPLITRIVTFVANRHHLSHADADDFRSDVMAKLIEHDYRVLRTFQGRSSMRTYLTTVVIRFLHDRRNHEWGKWRPSTEARREGPTAILLERLLIRDGLSFEEACSVMTINHHLTADHSELERLASRLPVRFRPRFELDGELPEVPGPDRADHAVMDAYRVAVSERTLAVLTSVLAGLESQDALILTMRFTDGMKVSDIAVALNLPPKSLYARVQRLLARLRESLEAQGIDAGVVLEPLGDR